MELSIRSKGDQFAKPGAYPALRRRIRAAAAGLTIPTVVVYAFDKRTRLLPYYFSCQRMAPAGARAVGAALYDSGLTRTRIVLQQWPPNFCPRHAKLDGDPVEMLLISSMQIHAEPAYRMIADACANPAPSRPLIAVAPRPAQRHDSPAGQTAPPVGPVFPPPSPQNDAAILSSVE